jgi:putative component of toxin-antitoxin plasmid stabilization module
MVDTSRTVNYGLQQVDILKSSTFDQWLKNLRDSRAKARIQMRIDYGPGYRVYYLRVSAVLVVLLCGGAKGSQALDIEKARQLAAEWRS